jgi:prepilin-type N-terminal cleavage/methylation domain-containing protein
MRQPVHKGFTLLELLMVLTLLGALFALVWPDFESASRSKHLEESAERIRTLVAMCRADAMNETVRYRIKVRPDGSLRVLRQAHPLNAPHLYIRPRVAWAQTAFLLDDVWVEALQILPDGPPPIRIVDEKLEFPETEIEPVPIAELGAPVEIDFDPDGTCNSLRWVLRDTRGFGLLLTLDGRLGRVMIEDWKPVPPEQLRRPEPWPEEEEPEYHPEDFQ